MKTRKVKKLICEVLDKEGRLEQTSQQTRTDKTSFDVPINIKDFKIFMACNFEYDVFRAIEDQTALYFRAGSQAVLVQY